MSQRFFAFNVWLEGYAATGERGGATFCGEIVGTSFEDACRRWAMRSSNPECYNEERNTYWGCRFYGNEADARRSFG